MAENKPYFTAPGWAPSTKQERQHRIDTANKNQMMKDATAITAATAVAPVVGAPAVAGAVIGGTTVTGLAALGYNRVIQNAGTNDEETPETAMADTGAYPGERMAVQRRQQKEADSKEYKARRKLEQDAVAAANAEAAAKGVSTTQLKEGKMKNPCWKGYEAYGMKKKNGKEVPNCVPVNEQQNLRKQLVKFILNEEDGTPPTGQPAGSSSDKPKTKRVHNILDAEGKPLEDRAVAPQEPERYSKEYDLDDQACKGGLCNIGNKRVRSAAQGFYTTNLSTMSPNVAYNKALQQTAAFRERGLKAQYPDTEIDSYPAYREVPDNTPATVKEELCQLTKQNIISNLIEAKDGPGKASQRPKSWNKGTKSGSEKRKMREQGKREAREMNEGRADDFFGTDEEGNTAGLGRNWGVEHEDDVEHPHNIVFASNFTPVSWQDRSLGYKAVEGSPVAVHGIPLHLLDMSTLLPKAEHEETFLQHPNAMPYLRAVKAAHWDGYQWAAEAARRGYSGARRAAAIYTGMGKATSRLMDILRDNQRRMPGSSTGDISENSYYSRLKNNLVETNYPGAHEDYEQLARSGGRDIELDADQEEARNKELADFHAMRTHVTPEEEAAMHDIFHKHLTEVTGKQHTNAADRRAEMWAAFHRAQQELDIHTAGRVKVLSDPNYPEQAMSPEHRLRRIHQLHHIADQAAETIRRQYFD